MIFACLVSCIGRHQVDVWKTITIAPEESITVKEVKAPVSLEIKNLSDGVLTIVSQMDMPKSLMPQSVLIYRLPKKNGFTLENKNPDPISIYLHYASSRPVLINNKELR